VAKAGFVSVKVRADFTAAPLSGFGPLSVTFTDATLGGPTSWSWDFGDGQTSTQQNPTHTFTPGFKFTVSLVASNAAGSDSVTKANYIDVKPPSLLNFSATPVTGTAPFDVSFSCFTLGTVDTWDWDFGDGGHGSGSTPVHTYQNAGTYSVILTVGGPSGSDSMTKTDLIDVAAPPPPPPAKSGGCASPGTAPTGKEPFVLMLMLAAGLALAAAVRAGPDRID
jgi:PKD repeat protein